MMLERSISTESVKRRSAR